MATALDRDILDAAIVGGLLLSAGGSGKARGLRNRRTGEQALDFGPVFMKTIDEFEDDDPVFVATGVGAPGFAKAVVTLRDSIEAARMLMDATGVEPACIMPGHVPGLNCWMQAAVFGVPVLDAATNGRGHPTVKMGGMGLTRTPSRVVTQSGCGGAPDDRVEIVVTGSMTKTSTIMRAASVQNGGSLAASRGPFPIALVREGGAPGAMSLAINIGRAMLAAAEGRARAQAAAAALGGDIVAEGVVVSNDVRYDSGFDVGTVVVDDPRGRLTLHIYNEFMAADRDGARVLSFPDMMGSLDRATGDVIAISEMASGREVMIVGAKSDRYPVGASARDPNVFPEVEEKLGVPLARYLTA
jgi:uncharacterized protein